jgi:hypothetical protein
MNKVFSGDEEAGHPAWGRIACAAFWVHGTASFSKRTEWCGGWECLGKSIVLAQFHGPANCVVGHQAYALYRLRWSARTGVSAARARKRKHDCGAFGTESFYSPIASTENEDQRGVRWGANASGKGRLRGSRMRVSNSPQLLYAVATTRGGWSFLHQPLFNYFARIISLASCRFAVAQVAV